MVDETTAYEAEALATRERIAATIDDLQTRLSPRRIMNNAVEQITETSSSALETVKSKAVAHPLILAGAGLAIGVGLLARSKIKGAAIEYGDSYAAYADYDDGYAANLSDGEGDVHGVGERLGALNNKAKGATQDNPLFVILVGLATGALIGAIAPASEAENRLVGRVRGRVSAAGRAAVDAARDKLDVSNFSLRNGVVGLADQASNALGSIADAARHELTRVKSAAR